MTVPLHLDTHVVVWIAGDKLMRLPASTRELIAEMPLRISPMVRLELAYLSEIGRITESAETVIGQLTSSVGLEIDDQPFRRVADIAADCSFTRDPFDRVITAQAIAAGTRLITSDERIRAARPDIALWD